MLHLCEPVWTPCLGSINCIPYRTLSYMYMYLLQISLPCFVFFKSFLCIIRFLHLFLFAIIIWNIFLPWLLTLLHCNFVMGPGVNSKHIHHFGPKKVKWKNMDPFSQCTWYHVDTIKTLNNGNIKSIKRYGFFYGLTRPTL